MKRAMIGLMIAVLLAAMWPAAAQDLTSSANQPRPEPFASLELLRSHPGAESAWSAVYEARQHFDGAAHEEYAYAAHDLFVENPRLLHDRFLQGDAKAIVLLQEVFVPGTWVLSGEQEGDATETERIVGRLKGFVAALEGFRPARQDYDRLAMHNAFVGRARALLQEWPEKRSALLQMRQ